jgi:hypothetical protein
LKWKARIPLFCGSGLGTKSGTKAIPAIAAALQKIKKDRITISITVNNNFPHENN